ncbi:hypothetical protein EV356DRAFT_98569 [Viridothelium virens]|uniref:Uncharacterized protein n=1 Tax=Viridothelium virens TaxID=1048519 RepID=A0A6A6HMN6_VIRVR|nr:hypothetical protein EV356DRAFT_98569 [Viridothelium virens]
MKRTIFIDRTKCSRYIDIAVKEPQLDGGAPNGQVLVAQVSREAVRQFCNTARASLKGKFGLRNIVLDGRIYPEALSFLVAWMEANAIESESIGFTSRDNLASAARRGRHGEPCPAALP